MLFLVIKKLYFYSLFVAGLLSEHSCPALPKKQRTEQREENSYTIFKEKQSLSGYIILHYFCTLAALCKTAAGDE